MAWWRSCTNQLKIQLYRNLMKQVRHFSQCDIKKACLFFLNQETKTIFNYEAFPLFPNSMLFLPCRGSSLSWVSQKEFSQVIYSTNSELFWRTRKICFTHCQKNCQCWTKKSLHLWLPGFVFSEQRSCNSPCMK